MIFFPLWPLKCQFRTYMWKKRWPKLELIRDTGDHCHKNWDVLLCSKNLLPSPRLWVGDWDFQRLVWAAGPKASGATKNLSPWQMRLGGCYLSPADRAGRDICSTGEMRSPVAFHRPAVTVTLIALDLSVFTHLSNAPDWAFTQHTLLSAPLGPPQNHQCLNYAYYSVTLLWLNNIADVSHVQL